MFNELKAQGFDFIVGVPDSALPGFEGIVAANEGNAVGLAIGYHLATGKTPVVYMQNSGIGNALNPITSLVLPYDIPMIFIIGDRGFFPQHEVDHEIGRRVFRLLEIPHYNLSGIVDFSQFRDERCAFFIDSETFKSKQSHNNDREKHIGRIVKAMPENSIVVSATGKISRELYEARKTHEKDFLCIGGMGHCIQVAAGIARQKPDRQVVCIDGDGSVLMHLGGLAVVAQMRLPNLTHIMLNNGAHDSVGGVPTVAMDLDFKQITEGMGYRYSRDLRFGKGPWFCERFVAKGARQGLGRPEESPVTRKNLFMEYLK